MSSNELIQKILNLNIVDVISKYLSVKKRGANYLAICPFHQDSNPSLTINDKKNIFKCFSCNESGNSITFVQKYKNLSFIQAVLEIANIFNFEPNLITKYNQEIETEIANNNIFLINELYAQLCNNFLFNKENSNVLEYLKKRGLNKEIIDYFQIGYNPNENGDQLYRLMSNNENNYLTSNNNCYTRQELLDANLIHINKNGYVQDVFANRIIFSIKNEDNKIVGFSGRIIDEKNNLPKYLNTIENKVFHKGQLLYHWNEAKQYLEFNKIFLVEGFMDVIALYKANIKNVVGTMGVSLSEYQIELFKKNKNIKHIILGFDNDNAGKLATITIGINLIKKGFNVFVIDQTVNDCKDFDEYINKHSPEKLNLLVNKQIHFSIFYINFIENKYKLENESDKQLFLNETLNIIKDYGNSVYKLEYINFLINKINYPIDVITKNVIDTLEEIKPIKNDEIIIKNQSSNKNNNFQLEKYLKIFKNMTFKILQGFFKSNLAINIFKNNYTLLGRINDFKEFNDVYDLLYQSFYFIHDFYDQYQQYNSIDNQESFNLLKDYAKTKIDKKKIIVFNKIFEEVYKRNQSIYFSYEYNTKIFHKTLIACLEADFESRKIFALNKIIDNYQKTGLLDEDSILLKYNELNKKIIDLYKKMKE